MTVKKRCELCINYLDCDIHDEVCNNLKFLQNFLDIEESEEIAKYCKSYGTNTRKELRTIKSHFRYIQGSE